MLDETKFNDPETATAARAPSERLDLVSSPARAFFLKNGNTTMDSKYCNGCSRQLPRTEFVKDNRAYDGLQSKCKRCRRARWHEYSRNHRRELSRARTKQRSTSQGQNKHRQQRNKSKAKWNDREKARRIVHESIRSGQLTRQICEYYGCMAIGQAHHDDYSKPLDVRWLCITHHTEYHVQQRALQLT